MHSEFSRGFAPSIIACVICFVVTLACCLFHNLMGKNTVTTLALDAEHYLESCRQMVMFAQDILHKGSIQQALVGRDAWFGNFLLLDGPVLPLLGSLPFIVLGHVPAHADWKVFVTIGSFLQAIGAALVCLLMMQFTAGENLSSKSRFAWGICAGLAWGLYPAGIVASGHFLTETPITVVMLALVASCVALLHKVQTDRLSLVSLAVRTLAVGLCAGLAILLKPAMLPAVVLVLAIALAKLFPKLPSVSSKIQSTFGLACGVLLIFIPWIMFAYAITGAVHVIPERTPAYNLAKGCDLEADGWSADPNPPVTEVLFKSKHTTTGAFSYLLAHPDKTVNLTLRKASRMWAWPWNQFRQNVFGITPGFDRGIHLAILIMGLSGALCVLAASSLSIEASFIGLASMAIVFGHLAYLPFETITRYGFTSMPFIALLAAIFLFLATKVKENKFLIAFAASAALLIASSVSKPLPYMVAIAGNAENALVAFSLVQCLLVVSLAIVIWQIGSKLTNAKLNLFFKSAVIIAAVYLTAIIAANASDKRDFREWECKLMPGQVASRSVAITPPNGAAKPDAAFVLVDGDATCMQAQVSVNGQKMDGQLKSIYQVLPNKFHILGLMRTFGASMNMTAEQARQWRVIEVPVSLLNVNGENVIEVTAQANAPVTIYGDYQFGKNDHIPMLAYDYFSFARLCNFADGCEGRLDDVGIKSAGTGVSTFKSGKSETDLSPAPGIQTGQYRLHLCLAFSEKPSATPSAQDNLNAPATNSFTGAIKVSDFDKLMRVHLNNEDVLCVNKMVLRSGKGTCAQIFIPSKCISQDYVSVRLTGKARALGKDKSFSVIPVLLGSGAQPQILTMPHALPLIPLGSDWTAFEINDTLPSHLLAGGLDSIVVALYPGHGDEIACYGPDRATGQIFVKDLQIEARPENPTTLANRKTVVF
jgi:hypothetical protein